MAHVDHRAEVPSDADDDAGEPLGADLTPDDDEVAGSEPSDILEGALVATAMPGEGGRHLRPPRDPTQRFVEEARRYPRLTEGEEKTLSRAARERGDVAAARKLVVHNLRLVIAIAYQYRRAWINMLDLFQEGSVGLMEAVRRWDPDLGTRFGSYAAYWIRAYILRFLMTNARLIHVGNTRAGRKLFFRLEKERQKLLAVGIDPTPRLLAAKLDVKESDVIEVAGHLDSREVPLAPRPDEEGIPLQEKLSGPGSSPEDQAARAELSDAVQRLTRRFESSLTDERERAIWREYLAAKDEPISLGTLGARYGVTKQRMGQIAEKLKKRFKEEAVRELGNDFQTAWQTEASE